MQMEHKLDVTPQACWLLLIIRRLGGINICDAKITIFCTNYRFSCFLCSSWSLLTHLMHIVPDFIVKKGKKKEVLWKSFSIDYHQLLLHSFPTTSVNSSFGVLQLSSTAYLVPKKGKNQRDIFQEQTRRKVGFLPLIS